jgi:hypothetical protein
VERAYRDCCFFGVFCGLVSLAYLSRLRFCCFLEGGGGRLNGMCLSRFGLVVLEGRGCFVGWQLFGGMCLSRLCVFLKGG